MKLLCSTIALATICAHAAPADESATWSVHVQSTYNVQTHGTLRAPYEGANSLQNRREGRGSFTATGFFGRRLWRGAELYVNPEAIAGSGISGVVGLAGPPNGETYRVDSQKLRLTLARGRSCARHGILADRGRRSLTRRIRLPAAQRTIGSS